VLTAWESPTLKGVGLQLFLSPVVELYRFRSYPIELATSGVTGPAF